MNEIFDNTELKPYQKTSYFILLVAVVIGGAGLILATSIYLPNVAFLTDVQRGQIMETMFNGWLTMSGIVAGGNVVARGGVTLLKQWLQNELAKNAAGISKTPDTANVATTGDVQTGADAGSTPVMPAEPSPDFPGDVPMRAGAPAPGETVVTPLPDGKQDVPPPNPASDEVGA